MQVSIVNEHKYRELEPLNEMLVKRGGVKMIPEPKFVISGLVDNEEYVIKLRIDLADEFRYSYQNQQWTPFAPSTKNSKLSAITETEHRKETGATWNMRIVQFDKLLITREFNDIQRNVIHVEPNHKYIPVLTIQNVTTGKSTEFQFQQMEFIAVKSYQSARIRHTKRAPRKMNLAPGSSQKPQLIVPDILHSPTYGFTAAPPPFPFEYWLLYPQIQYQIQQLAYSLPMGPPMVPIHHIQCTEASQRVYAPEYGWNSILMPGAHKEQDDHYMFHHEIWAPQDHELEKLHVLTEQKNKPSETPQ